MSRKTMLFKSSEGDEISVNKRQVVYIKSKKDGGSYVIMTNGAILNAGENVKDLDEKMNS